MEIGAATPSTPLPLRNNTNETSANARTNTSPNQSAETEVQRQTTEPESRNTDNDERNPESISNLAASAFQQRQTDDVEDQTPEQRELRTRLASEETASSGSILDTNA